MKSQRLIGILFILMAGKGVPAQSIEGVWKGTSSCQIKNSPCRDEIVVYHISKDSSGKSYEVIANKMVEGKEEHMGTLNFNYDDKKKFFVSVDSDRNEWRNYILTGNALKGTL